MEFPEDRGIQPLRWNSHTSRRRVREKLVQALGREGPREPSRHSQEVEARRDSFEVGRRESHEAVWAPGTLATLTTAPHNTCYYAYSTCRTYCAYHTCTYYTCTHPDPSPKPGPNPLPTRRWAAQAQAQA